MKLQCIHIFIAVLLAYALFARCTGKEGYANKYKAFPNKRVAKNALGDTVKNTSVEACKEKCDGNRACKGFVMKSDTECNLKSKGAPLEEYEGRTFYRKGGGRKRRAAKNMPTL